MISEVDIEAMKDHIKREAPDDKVITWVDQWDCVNEIPVVYAREFLKKFWDEWPGGFEEIEACITMWKGQLEHGK